ncbi:MAG: hypothetical protein IJ567_06955 [Lachnospiraceae bacterium]|nr:hypothetical protein [Lachnospiraceae bacterium]
MTKKKNGFLTFCFSLFPGAGEMYMGFMKMGVSLMAVFLAIIGLMEWLEIPALAFLAVLVWFYSFFHVHNLRGLDDEEFYAVEDRYLFSALTEENSGQKLTQTYRKVIAIVFIIIGVVCLWQGCYNILRIFDLPGIVYVIGNRLIPQFVVGIAIIALGIFLIRGKKQELSDEADREEEK